MKRTDLKSAEFDPYYERYIGKFSEETELRKGFEIDKNKIIQFFESIPETKLNYRYAPEKWSIKEVLQHLVDTERIFMHRCFRIARHDATSLAGFDQDVYIKPSGADKKSLKSLIEEFKAVRESSISLLQSVTNLDLEFVGISNGGALSARAAAFIILGHNIWHCEVIKERYL